MKCIDDEIPFEIPEGWAWCRISGIVQINPKNSAPDDAKAAFIPMEKIDATYLSSFTYEFRKWGDIKTGFTHFANGDIAFAKITPCFQNRKSMILVDLPNGIGAGTTELKVLRVFGDTINSKYLLFFLESPYFVEEASFKGTANQQRIISGYLENKLFPLPPKEEQKRIVKIIEDSFVFADSFGLAQSKLDTLNRNVKVMLKKSILQQAIQGRLVPQIAEEGTAQELLEQIRQEKALLVKESKLKKSALQDSVIFKGDDNRYYEQVNGQTTQIECDCEFPASWSVTRLFSVCSLIDGAKQEGQFVCLDAKYLRGKSSGEYLQKGRFVREGNNIILVDGENSGEVFTVPCDGYMGSTFKQLWVSSAMYMPYVLNNILFYKELLRQSKRGAAIPHLNKEVFYSLIIGIPPYREQVRIANLYEEIYSRI